MRLICPNCGAQYEVPDDVIPENGRDVQCSNCGTTWFQGHPSMEMEEDSAQDDLPEEAHNPKPRPRPERPREARRPALPPDVETVLKEEAAFEERARAAERGALESQPDLGLQDKAPAPRRRPPEEDKAPQVPDKPATEVDDTSSVSEPPPVVAPPPGATRKGRLPDVEDIDSTLRSAAGEASEAPQTQPELSIPEPQDTKTGSAFGKGFRWSISLAMFAAILYLFAPQVAEMVPESGPLMAKYTGWIDAARVWVDATFQDLLPLVTGGAADASAEG